MPPRKRARASAASTPLTEAQPKTPQDNGPLLQTQEETSPQNESILNDPWTDDQETALFKSMIRWKPTGLHKHFRMISIHNSMRSHGFITPETNHARIPGIWHKLNQLYDLSALDERENAHEFSDQPDPTDRADAPHLPEFQLPEDEFGEIMWRRRFRPESEGSSSPPLIPVDEDKEIYTPGVGLLYELPEEAKKMKEEAVAASTPAPKTTKGGARGSRAATKGARTAKVAQSAKNNKRDSTMSESAEDEEEEEEDDNSGESEEETAPSTRKTARGAAKSRPAPRRGRKR